MVVKGVRAEDVVVPNLVPVENMVKRDSTTSNFCNKGDAKITVTALDFIEGFNEADLGAQRTKVCFVRTPDLSDHSAAYIPS